MRNTVIEGSLIPEEVVTLQMLKKQTKSSTTRSLAQPTPQRPCCRHRQRRQQWPASTRRSASVRDQDAMRELVNIMEFILSHP